MILLLLPLVAAILVCERRGLLYPEEKAAYDSLYTHTFEILGESKPTARCERFEARTYGGKVFVYILRDSTRAMPHTGDTIIATTRIRKAEPVGSFDYHKYLLRQGIIGTAFVSDFRCLPVSAPPLPSLQKRLYDRLSAAGLRADELATTGALTLGYKEDLDPALRHRFQNAGAAHVLAVSGLHTGILYALLIFLLTLGGHFRPMHENRVGRCVISCLVIACMWCYAWLTGMTPSVVRAVVMVTMLEIGRMCYRQPVSLNTVAAAAVLILLVRPLDLWSVSFQLSFTATAAIVIVARKAEMYIHRLDLQHTLGGRTLSWIIGTVIISFAAQWGTLPVTIHYFGQISTYFLLTNLIILPLATLLMPCGLISMTLGGTAAGIGFSKITWALSWAMNNAVGWIENLPASTVPAHANSLMVIIYYVLSIFCVLLFAYSKKK